MKAKPSAFPMRIKAGSATVVIYDRKPGFPYFRLAGSLWRHARLRRQ